MKTKDIVLRNVAIEELIEEFTTQFEPEFSKLYSSAGYRVYMFIMEYYFLRIGSNLACIIVIESKENNDIGVTLTIAGGAQGTLKIGWGSENKKLRDFLKFFEKYQV